MRAGLLKRTRRGERKEVGSFVAVSAGRVHVETTLGCEEAFNSVFFSFRVFEVAVRTVFMAKRNVCLRRLCAQSLARLEPQLVFHGHLSQSALHTMSVPRHISTGYANKSPVPICAAVQRQQMNSKNMIQISKIALPQQIVASNSSMTNYVQIYTCSHDSMKPTGVDDTKYALSAEKPT